MDDFNLDDFLSAAGGAYTAYSQAQNSQSQAQTAAANLAAQQALLANTNAMSAQTKTWLVLGGGILIAVVLVIFVIRKIK